MYTGVFTTEIFIYWNELIECCVKFPTKISCEINKLELHKFKICNSDNMFFIYKEGETKNT